MPKSVRIVLTCAALGFLVPFLLLAYAWLTGYLYIDRPLFALCPASVASMALDHASTSTAIVVWFFIALSNACLYAFPAATVSVGIQLARTLRAGGQKPPSILF